MTDFYRFPAMAKLNEWTDAQQMQKSIEEDTEAYQALLELTKARIVNAPVGKIKELRREYGMEQLDRIHAAETALRMEFTDEEVKELHRRVIDKNRKRGYYDD